jgi:hypothetical protein
MHQFHDTELQQSETVTELINNEPASVGKQDGIGNNNVARIAVLAVVAIGVLMIPLATLLSNRAHLLPKLPIFIGSRARWIHSVLVYKPRTLLHQHETC